MANPMNRRAAISALAAAGAMHGAPKPVKADGPSDPAAIITAEQLADLDIVAWEHADDEWTPPSDDEWAQISKDHLISLRIAWRVMYKSKAELETIARQLEDENFQSIVGAIGNARDHFARLSDLLESAEIRLMCGATSALKKDNPAEFAEA